MDLDTARGMVLVQLRRKRQGRVSQQTIADEAGLNISSVVRAERGRPSSDDTLEAIAACYGRTLESVLAEAASLQAASGPGNARRHIREINQVQQRDEWIGLWAVTPEEARASLLAHATELVRDVIRASDAKKTEGQS